MSERTTLNDALRLLRLYCGFSQSEMAKRLEVAQSLVSEIERGKKSVSMDLLRRYSEATGTRMSQLLFFAEEIEGERISGRGQLLVADKVVKLLEKLRPRQREDA